MIKASYRTKADYSRYSYFEPIGLEPIYNLIMMPKTTQLTININDIVYIKHKDQKYHNKQFVVFESDIINIFDQDYYYFYLANGITISEDIFSQQDDYSIIINDIEYPLNLIFNDFNNNKLLRGAMVLSCDALYGFKNEDIIQLNMDNIYSGRIKTAFNKFNYYMPTTNNTILILDISLSLDILSAMNDYSSCYLKGMVRSYTTRINNNKGSIAITITPHNNITLNDYEYTVFCECIDNDYNKIMHTNNKLELTDLTSGTYTIKIIDSMGDSIRMINDHMINEDSFDIYIADSVEKEHELLKSSLSQEGSINLSYCKNIGSLPHF